MVKPMGHTTDHILHRLNQDETSPVHTEYGWMIIQKDIETETYTTACVVGR